MKDRVKCPKCHTKQKYYCPNCFISLAENTPKVNLPIPVSVLQHPKEKVKRSSIIPSKILSPDKVEIYRTEVLPENLKLDPETTLFLYPTKNAKTLKEIGKEKLSKINHLLMIDSTWAQVNTFMKIPEINKLQAVKITTTETTFWRYQQVDSSNLATIEALYFFFKEYDEVMRKEGENYDGKYDNLLYFYTFNYNLIQERYSSTKKDVFFITFFH